MSSPADSTNGTPDDLLSSGYRIAGYTITRFLGRGAMGEVYEATFDKTGKAFALKLLSQEMMGRESAVERFQREAKIMVALDHPHIAKVFDCGETDGRHWLCIELLGVIGEDGKPMTTLEDLISSKGGKLVQEQVQAYMGQFLDALSYAHGKGLIHRDLKPANILLSEEGMKIADFGLVDAAGSEWMATQVKAIIASTIARGIDATMLETHGGGTPSSPQQALLGTYAYMSPEQKEGWDATERSDLFAAGLMCFHMLTGSRNLGLEMPSEMDGTLWKGWDSFIRKALRTNPEERFADASEMSAALLSVGNQVEDQELVGSGLSSPSDSQSVTGKQPTSEPASESNSASGNGSNTLAWALGMLVLALTAWGVGQWWGSYSEKLEGEREIVETDIELDSKVPSTEDDALKPGKGQAPVVELSKGGLLLNSTPYGAQVFLDGKSMGSTPLTLRDVVAKRYSLLLKKVGFEDFESEVTVVSEQFNEPEDMVLIPSVGSVRISIEPSGWDVRLESKKLLADELEQTFRQGKTPVVWSDLSVGMYRVILEKPLWEQVVESVEVVRGKEMEFSKKFSSGNATLTSNWEGAKAHIRSLALLERGVAAVDAKDISLPLEDYVLPTGRYEVVVTYDGFQPLRLPMNVAGGRSVAVEAKFDSPYGKVKLKSEPPGAEVFVGIRKIGVTPLELYAPIGNASYSLRMNGYLSAEVSGLVEEGGNLELQQTLKELPSVIKVPEIGLEMIKIEPGTFMMGSPSSERNREDDERQHRVTLTKAFWLGKYEVTQSQWKAVMGNNPSHFTGNDLPVEKVSWEDAMAFCRKLNQMDSNKPRGYVYGLPTEAQWEYACRAGTTTATAFGDSLSSREANFDGNYPYGGASKGPDLKRTTAVGSYRPNAWGFYDMHGNVWEWCQDWYGDYPGGRVTDPVGFSSGADRVERGGSWVNFGRFCRSAYRFGDDPGDRYNNLGFRLSLRSE